MSNQFSITGITGIAASALCALILAVSPAAAQEEQTADQPKSLFSIFRAAPEKAPAGNTPAPSSEAEAENKAEEGTRPAAPRRQAAPQQSTPYQREVARANENTVFVISGNPNGTYLTIAYDLSAVLDGKNDLRVLPMVGRGSVQNIRDVLFLRNVDLAITRTNVVSQEHTGDMQGFRDKIVYIAKLFNEEIHVYGRSDITSLRDLHGRKVNFSDVGSGTQFSARQVFAALGIQPIEVNMGQADGIEAMRRGEIVATVLEAGKPSAVFQSLQPDPAFHFLGVDYAAPLQEDFFPAELTHEDYPSLIAPGATVDTVATGAILVAYDWPRDSERYRRIAKFTEALFDNLGEFHNAPRHPKWRETNMAAEVSSLKRFQPAQDWIDRNLRQRQVQQDLTTPPATTASTAPDTKERQEFERFLTQSGHAPADAATREQLYQQFVNWQRGRNR